MDVCITRRVNIASTETLIKPIDILLKMNLTECTRAERPQATFTLSIAGITADEMNYIVKCSQNPHIHWIQEVPTLTTLALHKLHERRKPLLC